MELRHLRYFVVLAEELHFGRAARRLHITQPPLSVNLRQLEGSVGAKLLERGSHGVKLTPAGEAFRRSALRVLAETSAAVRQARDVGSGVTSRVRVGFVGSMTFRGLPERLTAFRAAHPRVQVELIELNSAEQLDAIARGAIDLGFVHSSRVPPELRKKLFMTEPFVCCLPAGHPAARARRLDAERLRDDPLVLFSRGASPDYYERVLALCAELGLDPMVRHEVRHWLSVVSLVGKGMGIALVPRSLANAGIAGVRFRDLPETSIRSEVFAVWNERNAPVALAELVAALTSEGPVVP
jgi:DNA-binding transcriptional LysR family regulator